MCDIYMNPNDFMNMSNLQESESESSESESSESESESSESESESSESESSESESSEESSESESSESESESELELELESLIISRFQTGKVDSKISYKIIIKWLKNEIELESMKRKKI
jgi:cobalamin biosynthesis protein CobT